MSAHHPSVVTVQMSAAAISESEGEEDMGGEDGEQAPGLDTHMSNYRLPSPCNTCGHSPPTNAQWCRKNARVHALMTPIQSSAHHIYHPVLHPWQNVAGVHICQGWA